MPSVGEIWATDCMSTPARPTEPLRRSVWTMVTGSGASAPGERGTESSMATAASTGVGARWRGVRLFCRTSLMFTFTFDLFVVKDAVRFNVRLTSAGVRGGPGGGTRGAGLREWESGPRRAAGPGEWAVARGAPPGPGAG